MLIVVYPTSAAVASRWQNWTLQAFKGADKKIILQTSFFKGHIQTKIDHSGRMFTQTALRACVFVLKRFFCKNAVF